MTNSTPAISGSPTSTEEKLLFYPPLSDKWKELKPVVADGTDPDIKNKILSESKQTMEELKSFLLTSLQMQHVVVLAGCGTSHGAITKGPSMMDLWKCCVLDDKGSISEKAAEVIAKTEAKSEVESQNIEALLSRCEAYLQIKTDADVSTFLTASKTIILHKCSTFISASDNKQLAAHRTFLHRLSRRRVRDSRLKLFTTNYDLCFETAAGRQGLVVIDGFSFTQPRHFDPRYFLFDIVRRPATGDEVGTPLEGVFHIYKLHGSVNWTRTPDGEIEIDKEPKPECACLIYPAKGKYQQSYVQPHLEIMSQYLSVLREPNTCIIVIGFGFNDDHLAEPILAAVRTNPHLRLIVVNPICDDITAGRRTGNRYWDNLFNLAKQGEDVWLINSSFGDFAEMIPDLKSLTPAQRLARDIKQVTK